MKTSRTLILRHLTMVALALSLTLASSGSIVLAALGYADAPPTPTMMAAPQVTAAEADEALPPVSQAGMAGSSAPTGLGTAQPAASANRTTAPILTPKPHRLPVRVNIAITPLTCRPTWPGLALQSCHPPPQCQRKRRPSTPLASAAASFPLSCRL